MRSLNNDIKRLSSRIAEIDATIDELTSRIDDRQNARSKLYRAMHREHLRLRNTAARKLEELSTLAANETTSQVGSKTPNPVTVIEPLLNLAPRRTTAIG